MRGREEGGRGEGEGGGGEREERERGATGDCMHHQAKSSGKVFLIWNTM